MILHLCDDEKFIDKAVNNFTKIQPNNHEFIAITNKKFKYIKNDVVKKRSILIFINPIFLLSLHRFEAIIFHKLTISRALFAIIISRYVKIIWNGLGADYYDLITDKENLFLTETRELYLTKAKNNNILNRIKKRVSIHLRRLVLKRITYFSPVLKSEFELLKNTISGFKPEFIDWTYGVMTDAFDQINSLKVDDKSKKNVLVGNSATFENNHIDVFRIIKKVNDNMKIIVPLSYGDIEYKNEIKIIGKNLFGNNFIAQEDFLKFSEYLQLINSCNYIIMNHLRQQGLGNIYLAILLGKSLYIQEKNPIYNFLIEQKVAFFTINDLEEYGFKKLEKEEKEQNRRIIFELMSEKLIIQKTNNLIDIINK